MIYYILCKLNIECAVRFMVSECNGLPSIADYLQSVAVTPLSCIARAGVVLRVVLNIQNSQNIPSIAEYSAERRRVAP